MTPWQRWRFRARLRAIRADLDRISQRITETEKRITQLASQVASNANAINRLQENNERPT